MPKSLSNSTDSDHDTSSVDYSRGYAGSSNSRSESASQTDSSSSESSSISNLPAVVSGPQRPERPDAAQSQAVRLSVRGNAGHAHFQAGTVGNLSSSAVAFSPPVNINAVHKTTISRSSKKIKTFSVDSLNTPGAYEVHGVLQAGAHDGGATTEYYVDKLVFKSHEVHQAETLLSRAILEANYDKVKYYLDHGADVNQAVIFWVGGSDLVLWREEPEFAEQCYCSDCNCVNCCSDQKNCCVGEPKNPNNFCDSPLTLALRHVPRSTDIIQLLLERGANVNFRPTPFVFNDKIYRFSRYDTALHLAIKARVPHEIISHMVAQGANPKASSIYKFNRIMVFVLCFYPPCLILMPGCCNSCMTRCPSCRNPLICEYTATPKDLATPAQREALRTPKKLSPIKRVPRFDNGSNCVLSVDLDIVDYKKKGWIFETVSVAKVDVPQLTATAPLVKAISQHQGKELIQQEHARTLVNTKAPSMLNMTKQAPQSALFPPAPLTALERLEMLKKSSAV